MHTRGTSMQKERVRQERAKRQDGEHILTVRACLALEDHNDNALLPTALDVLAATSTVLGAAAAHDPTALPDDHKCTDRTPVAAVQPLAPSMVAERDAPCHISEATSRLACIFLPD